MNKSFSYINDHKDTLLSYLQQYYETYTPDELLFSERFDLDELITLFGQKVFIPLRGDKKN